jgi:predicted acyltransferase
LFHDASARRADASTLAIVGKSGHAMPRSPSEEKKVTVVFLDDDPLLKQAPAAKAKKDARPKAASGQVGGFPPTQRVASIDAYRGFVMLLMASGALGFARIVATQGGAPEPPAAIAEAGGAPSWWASLWNVLAYQFDHVPWVGCTIWDLIQPSFMFIVGAAMPFSFAKRSASGQGALRRGIHVVFRALVLVALGVFLSSNGANYKQTNFTFVNVLTQIGLGYVFVYLLLNRPFWVQLTAAVVILAGYWAAFYVYVPAPAEAESVAAYVANHQAKDPKHRAADEGPYAEGTLAAHWNKHTNFAAAVDRWLLNQLPRQQEPWSPDGSSDNARRFWINEGGYQTLNFIPSMATMLFGVMAGQLLLSGRRRKVLTLLAAGALCFVIVLALDTTIWPVKVQQQDGSVTLCASGLGDVSAGDASLNSSDLWPNWSVCPTVKRIWTPTWAIFSTGWTLWLLAGFYLVMDVWGWKWWAFPLTVVGMNSIAMYVMAQLMPSWIRQTLQTHIGTASAVTGNDLWGNVFGANAVYAPLWSSVAVLAVLWLICLWMYRQRIFVRI